MRRRLLGCEKTHNFSHEKRMPFSAEEHCRTSVSGERHFERGTQYVHFPHAPDEDHVGSTFILRHTDHTGYNRTKYGQT